MNKIPSVYLRDFGGDPRFVLPDPNPDAAWVHAGEGVATRKYDGTCVMFDGDAWWARREVKAGKPTPANFRPVETDDNTGKIMGWVPMDESGFQKFHAEALATGHSREYLPGTYELCGPKVNGNPEGFECHTLVRHAGAEVLDAPRDFAGLGPWLHARAFEGIVWHHPDGRMAKIKSKDFRR